ncbi:MAG: hypothetical protein QNK31_09735 [Porticoccus sp.]|nr:hypothetical protein [Porticoccus sp.]
MPDSKPWWGDFSFAEQQRRYWSIGERKLVIQRLSCEWNTWNIDTETEIRDLILHGESSHHEPLEDKLLARHLQTATMENIRVMPALADRSVVARPNVPLRLLGGEKTRIYVSTPLWFKAQTLPGKLCLLDVPFWRPSDSWFGPSTREGEMCYAKYTEARLQLELLEQRPHRAVTPVFIHNKQKETLLIERLNVPVPLLSLYQHTDKGLWTEAVNVTREEDDERVELVLEKQAPSEVRRATLVAGPRIASARHTLIRSLGSLFS